MPKMLEKIERRLGEKLFLKGDRCAGPKCAVARRSYPPGAHGKTGRRRRESSEFGSLLQEKQKLRYLYGLDDTNIKKYIKEAVARRNGTFSSTVLLLLEKRLDAVVFRFGFAVSRRKARQVVSHGHIAVNGKMVTSPSYCVKRGDLISIKEKSSPSGAFAGVDERLRFYQVPRWLELDQNRTSGKMISDPVVEDLQTTIDITKIKEFYFR